MRRSDFNPKDVEAYNNRCWTRTVIGELPSARRDCDEALRLRPDFVDALDSRGLLNLKSGANKDAITDFDAALKINPRLTSSLYGRGLARQRSGAVAEGAWTSPMLRQWIRTSRRSLPDTACADVVYLHGDDFRPVCFRLLMRRIGCRRIEIRGRSM